MARNTETIRAAYITAIATVIGAMIGLATVLFSKKDSEKVQPQSVIVQDDSESFINKGSYIRNNPISKNASEKRIYHRRRDIDSIASKLGIPIKQGPSLVIKEDSTESKLDNKQRVAANAFDSNETQHYGLIETNDDASVAFYIAPTDNMQPKGYIPSGSKVLIVKVSEDRTMTRIKIDDKSGWIPTEKILPLK